MKKQYRKNEMKRAKEGEGFFNSIPVNKRTSNDVVTSLPDDEVHYPKLNLRNECTSVDNLWMVGFLHHNEKSKERKAQRELGHMIQLPGSSMLPEAANALDKLSTTKKHHKSSPTLGQTEDQRLRDAAKRLSAKSLGSKLKSSPYQTTNVSLRRTRRKQKSSKLHYNAQMRSKLLEQYFLINRNEQEAAICLQCFWRRIIAIRYLHRLSVERMSAIVIQAAVRSMLTRIWLREWKRKRAYYIVRCQAYLRRRVASRRFWRWKRIEYECACKIQSTVRMFLARCQLLFMIKTHASCIITKQYRGHRARKRFNQKRQNHYVTKIQTYVRIHQSKRDYVYVKAKKEFAAKGIQRCWKGYLSRKLMAKILYDRFKQSCKNQVSLYSAEIEYFVSVLDNLTLSEAEDAEGNINALEHEKDVCEASIVESEKNMNELRRTLAQLTPRSVQQGWKEQIEKSIEFERSILTAKKIQVLFYTRKRMRANEEGNTNLHRRRQECLRRIEALQRWSDNLSSMLHQEERRIKHEESKRIQRQAVADQKRLWAVELKTDSGKPLKPRTSISDVDPTSREHKLMELLKLQSYQTNVSQMRKVLEPLGTLSNLW